MKITAMPSAIIAYLPDSAIISPSPP